MDARIVSLAPSATTTIRAMGQGNAIVGHTQESLATSTVVGGWLTPDIDAIEALAPDFVITTDELQRPIHDTLQDRGIDSRHFSPATVTDVRSYIMAIGELLDVEPAAIRTLEAFTDRIETVREAVAGRDRPVVYCEEWQHPPMVAGNWVPEVVELAGGRYPFLEAGERSCKIAKETVEENQPELAILHICGQGNDVESQSFATRGWEIPAVETGRISVVDDALLNQPSPRLAGAVERLAGLIHPEARIDAPSVDSS